MWLATASGMESCIRCSAPGMISKRTLGMTSWRRPRALAGKTLVALGPGYDGRCLDRGVLMCQTARSMSLNASRAAIAKHYTL
jgi:hypothetical protein